MYVCSHVLFIYCFIQLWAGRKTAYAYACPSISSITINILICHVLHVNLKLGINCLVSLMPILPFSLTLIWESNWKESSSSKSLPSFVELSVLEGWLGGASSRSRYTTVTQSVTTLMTLTQCDRRSGQYVTAVEKITPTMIKGAQLSTLTRTWSEQTRMHYRSLWWSWVMTPSSRCVPILAPRIRCSKIVIVDRTKLQIAVFGAASVFNECKMGRLGVIELPGLKYGHNLMQMIQSIDKKHVTAAIGRSTPTAKKQKRGAKASEKGPT